MSKEKKNKHPMAHLLAGGCAGLVESSVCHPLDTIKTRMQLRRQEASVEKVVVKIRHSLVEPALRIKHSLQEPSAYLKSATTIAGVGHEPAMFPPAGAATSLTSARSAMTEAVVVKPPQVHKGTVQAPLGPIGTARRIVQREGFLALYKGLSAVYTGIVPKMAIRFLSFEQYREGLAQVTGERSTRVTFVAGLASGLTEAILVVTPVSASRLLQS